MCGAGSAGLLAGCTADDEETGDGDLGSPDSDGGAADDGSSSTDSTTESDGLDDPAELRPSTVDFAPTDAWTDAHPPVEIPDTPGTAIFTLEGERLELEGDVSGGTLSEDTYQAIQADDEWRSGVSYFSIDAEYSFGERGANYPDRLSIVLDQAFYVASGTDLAWLQYETLFLAGGSDVGGIRYQYGENPDGSLLSGDLPGIVRLDESFVTWNRDGVFTAVGEIPEDSETGFPAGRFELGGRSDQSWLDHHGET